MEDHKSLINETMGGVQAKTKALADMRNICNTLDKELRKAEQQLEKITRVAEEMWETAGKIHKTFRNVGLTLE